MVCWQQKVTGPGDEDKDDNIRSQKVSSEWLKSQATREIEAVWPCARLLGTNVCPYYRQLPKSRRHLLSQCTLQKCECWWYRDTGRKIDRGFDREILQLGYIWWVMANREMRGDCKIDDHFSRSLYKVSYNSCLCFIVQVVQMMVKWTKHLR